MENKTRVVTEHLVHKGHQIFLTCVLEIASQKPDGNSYQIKRELLKTTDSVLVLLFAPEIDSFLFCQQFRTGVFFNNTGDDPFILECVAGAIDEGAPENTAIKEVFEETGIKITQLEKIASVYKSPGIMTEKNHLFYAEVNGTPQTGFYGVDDEDIRTHVMRRKEAYQLMDDMKIMDMATLLALTWFRLVENK
jgi:ADP-ribose pyrophosphatase